MISRVTEVVAEIEARPQPKEKVQRHTWCVIEEVDFGSWGVGGNLVTPEIIKAMLEGKKLKRFNCSWDNFANLFKAESEIALPFLVGLTSSPTLLSFHHIQAYNQRKTS